jgi:hypothetical protein
MSGAMIHPDSLSRLLGRKTDLRRKKFRILKHILIKYKDKDLRHPKSLPNYIYFNMSANDDSLPILHANR